MSHLHFQSLDNSSEFLLQPTYPTLFRCKVLDDHYLSPKKPYDELRHPHSKSHPCRVEELLAHNRQSCKT
jgi:hypothetical protein